MAFPASGFAYATGALASSGYSDGVLVVDLSELPADWWNAIDTADTTKARFGIGGTEVAGWVDPETFVDNMDGTGEGTAYIYYSSVSAVTGQVAGIQPPKAANASYAAGDTYGRNAVWATRDAVYTFGDDPSLGTLSDVSGNGLNATSSGTWASGDRVAGKVGNAFDFSGSNSFALPNVLIDASDTQVAFKLWLKADSAGYEQRPLSYNQSGVGYWVLRINAGSSNNVQWYVSGSAVSVTKTSAGVTSDTHIVVTSTESGNIELFVNGVSAGTQALGSFTAVGFDGNYLGASRDNTVNFAGLIGGPLEKRSTNPSAAAVAHNYANESDPATFWGTWTWEAPVAPTTIYQRRRAGVYRVGSRSVA